MSNPYINYLATTSYRPYLQPTPGLGSSARTGIAIWVGGPRAGAGSASRIYNFFTSTGQLSAALSSPRAQAIRARGAEWAKSRLYAGSLSGLNLVTL